MLHWVRVIVYGLHSERVLYAEHVYSCRRASSPRSLADYLPVVPVPYDHHVGASSKQEKRIVTLCKSWASNTCRTRQHCIDHAKPAHHRHPTLAMALQCTPKSCADVTAAAALTRQPSSQCLQVPVLAQDSEHATPSSAGRGAALPRVKILADLSRGLVSY